MKAYKFLFLILLAVFLAGPALVSSQEVSLPLDDQAQLLAALGFTEAASDDNLIGLAVTPDDVSAGALSAYVIDFDITQSVFEMLKNGGLKFAFPAGFDLTQIQAIEISDNYEPLELEVADFVITDRLLTINLQQAHLDETIVSDADYIHVTLVISFIGNPTQAGGYQLAAVAFKQNNAIVAGPTFSSPFAIEPDVLSYISVTPADDITLMAGQTQQFGAEGFDQYGNKIDGLLFSWSLDCGECIGYFTDSTFHATVPGQARAVAGWGNITGESGLITVLTGGLDHMDLVVAEVQFVGYPLRGRAEISLYDAGNNLITDYSLSQQPVSLVISEGTLSPSVLSDDDLFSGGIIDFIPAGVTYEGLSATTVVNADNGDISSNAVSVSFNAYDVVDALDAQGETISHVFANHQATAYVVVQNLGNLRPNGDVEITAQFATVTTPTVTSFSPGPAGTADTVEVQLPVIADGISTDVLTLTADAQFVLNGVNYSTQGSAEYSITVLEAEQFTVVEDSFKPDTILAGLPFDISFDVFVGGFFGQIDSTYLSVQLVSASGGGVLATLYQDYPQHSSFQGGIITYEGLVGILQDLSVPVDTWHPVRLDYRVYSSGDLFTLQDDTPDSIFVLPDIQLTEDISSLMPTSVSANSDVAFRFVVNLANDFPLGFVADGSSFTVTGEGFSTTTTLSLDDDSIEPGDNQFNTERIFIPQSQMDRNLAIRAVIGFTVPGITGNMAFVTDFGQMLVPVTALPMIEIQSVDVLAPNAPTVNTNQFFQVRVVVANVSETPAESLVPTLTSDGSSVFNSSMPPMFLGGNDTAEVVWDVTAAPDPNSAEIFVADVLPDGIAILPPLDNVALVTIETPADLELTHSLFGVENGSIDYGNDFNLTVELVNSGMAEVTDAGYVLVAEGLDLGGPDTLEGRISVGRHIEFSFTAPQRDTTINLSFALTTLPVDVNTGLQAVIDDTSFAATITVIATDASLFVQTTPLGSNLVLPGREKELVQIDLTNTGISAAATMQLDRILLLVQDPQGNALDVMSVFDIGRTGFYEDGEMISRLTAGNERMIFSFDQLIINPQQTRSLVLKAEFKVTSAPSVILQLAPGGLVAHFTEGPNVGQAPTIVSDSEEGEPMLIMALAIKEASLGGSFIAETNPFNPENPDVNPVPLHLSYELAENATVEFRILSLTGEEVYFRTFESGRDGGSAGENIIEWDGCNSQGHVVLNGVYVALIHNTATGESARLKIAVIK